MRPSGMLAIFLVLLTLLVAPLLGCGSALAAPTVNGVFPLNSELGTNSKIAAGPDGNVWVTVESATNDVARITPAGAVQEFDIEGIEAVSGIAAGPDGNLWITGVEKAARFNPGNPTGTDQTFTVAGIGAEGQIVAGPDRQMWVASNNSVVHFATTDPTGSVQPVTLTGALAPKDIDVAGSLIAIADGGGENRIVTFTTAGAQKDYAIGGPSQGLAGAASSEIAFSAPLATPEQSGLISPPNPGKSFELLGDPFGVAFGADGAFWIVQSAAGQLARVAADGQLSFLTGLPVESPRQIAAGPGNTLWVTLQKNPAKGVPAASVARISGVEPPQSTPVPPRVTLTIPETKIDRGPKKVVKTRTPKAKVRFSFSSPGAAAAFQCSLTRLLGKGTKFGPFKACSSPAVYRLRPGRYSFRVRAFTTQTDPTPAVRNFRVVRIGSH